MIDGSSGEASPGAVPERPRAHRSGVVALLGRPNAGKSTLMNALLGERLAITSPRAQTTRGRLLGVLTRPTSQIAFCDTPGLHAGGMRFNRAMNETALRTALDADLRVLLLPADARWDEPEQRLLELPGRMLLVRTKIDLASVRPVPVDPARFVDVLGVAALRGTGLARLLDRIEAELPEGPALYPEDYLTDRPLRFLAAEQVREVAFELLRDEVPYALAVEVEEWKETGAEVRIRANLLLERESQKGIVVGRGGRTLKALGVESRKRLEAWLEKKVHLGLWVKTDRNWSRRPRRARELGYLH